jgi:hypothetical protein
MMSEIPNLELQLRYWAGKRRRVNVEALSTSEQICVRVMNLMLSVLAQGRPISIYIIRTNTVSIRRTSQLCGIGK